MYQYVDSGWSDYKPLFLMVGTCWPKERWLAVGIWLILRSMGLSVAAKFWGKAKGEPSTLGCETARRLPVQRSLS